MMHDQQDLQGNASVYPWMSQFYMVVQFPMFKASNNLEGLRVALRICCTDGACVHVCVLAVCERVAERQSNKDV